MAPGAGALKLCQCHLCIKYTARDPDTGTYVPGLLIKRGIWSTHQKAFTAYQKDARERDEDSDPLVEAVINTTLGPSRVDDPLTSTRSGDRPSGFDETLDADVPTGTVAGDHTAGPTPSETPSPMNVNLEKFSNEINLHQTEFLRRKSQFSNPEVTFERDVDLTSTSPPPLKYSSNIKFLQHQDWVSKTIDDLDSLDVHGSPELRIQRRALIMDMQEHQTSLDLIVSQTWDITKLKSNSAESDPTIPKTVDTSNYYNSFTHLEKMSAPLLACLITAIILHLIPGLSTSASNFSLVASRITIASACITYVKACGLHGDFPSPIDVLRGTMKWPTDIRTAMKEFDINPEIVKYACCPTCYSIYAPKDNDNPKYPPFCTFREFKLGNKCGARLIKEQVAGKPTEALHIFGYQPLESWLGRLLSRPGLTEKMQNTTSSWRDGFVLRKDVFGADALKNFLGPDKKYYLNTPAGELRLVFNLNIDWFNPFGNRQAKAKGSVGGIYMVCMNLPIYLRYRVENVYLVGIIPGPHEPSLHHINHLLRPLVDDLLRFWSPGVHFSRTASNMFGQLVRCALLAVVCDLPAIRKVAGGAGITSNHVCNMCKLLKSQISNFNVKSWPRWTRKDHYRAAEKWRDAPDEAGRLAEFDENGIRWSELFRLPYWDPLKFAVVDAMHNLFLNDLKIHCRTIWGMDSSVAPHKTMKPHTQLQQNIALAKVLQAIRNDQPNTIATVRKGYITAFVRDNVVHVPYPKATKNQLSEALVKWHKANPTIEIKVPMSHQEPTLDLSKVDAKPTILDNAVLKHVWSDMRNTILPSWLASPPKNLGTTSHGKLKADQWRTACTVTLVFTLIHLWGQPGTKPMDKLYLDNFLALVTAVKWATKRSMSDRDIKVVEDQFLQYFTGVVALFSADVLHPNHHMSFHLAECIRNFGPVHGWWAFPFERYNGIIQRHNTNRRYGQLELTFMRTFCRGGNLKALMSREELPEILEELKPAFHQHFGTEFRGTLLNDLLALGAQGETLQLAIWDREHKGVDLPDVIYRLLIERINRSAMPLKFRSYLESSDDPALEPNVQHHRRLKIGGLDFAIAKSSKGNSQVLFRPRPDQKIVRAGIIQEIFVHRRLGPNGDSISQYFITVLAYEELTPEEMKFDPYRRYPLLDVWLCRDQLAPEIQVITMDDVISHYASCLLTIPEIDGSLKIILSLDRS